MPTTDDLPAFLAEVSARSSAPGGGAVVGLLGAEAAALAGMVCAFSDERFADDKSLCDQLITRFLALPTADSEAFTALMAAYALPKKGADRASQIQAGLRDAMGPSRAALELTTELEPLVLRLAEAGNANLVTDTAMAAAILVTTIDSAELNILINLRSIKDAELKGQVTAELDRAHEQRTKLSALREALTDSLR